MDIQDLILSDEALAVIDAGAWVDMDDEAPGVELMVVGLQSEEARKATRYKQATARKKNRGKELSDEQHATIMKEVLSEVVLRGWRGLKSNGEPVEYSKEIAHQWITSRGGEKFTGLVLVAAQRLDAQANEFVEGVAKN